MHTTTTTTTLSRSAFLLRVFSEYELGLCSYLNGACRVAWMQQFFSVISRLGDGIFWYALVLLLPAWYGDIALSTSLHMFVVGLIGLGIYKLIKSTTERHRPYTLDSTIQLGSAPLDKYSFPSGHTLHAASFTTVAISYHPELAWMLLPFVLLVALSRVILGLHYPTDVAVGAVIGSTLAKLSLLA